MAGKARPDVDVDDGPIVPMTVGADDAGNGGIQVNGLFDAGDGRVLIWMASDPDGAYISRDSDDEPVPFIVFWNWDQPDPDGRSPGGGWEYRTAQQARRRFVRELAQAMDL